MAGRNGQELLTTWVPADLAARFRSQARVEGGVSAALRQMVAKAAAGRPPAPPPGPAGFQVTVRLRDTERWALLRAAEERGMPAAAYLRSLAVVHFSGRPQWSQAEVEALRAIGMELRRIGNNVNQIARALNAAAYRGECPEEQGTEAIKAVEMVRSELRRVLAIYTGNLRQWGRPEDEHPIPEPGVLAEAERREQAGRARAHRRPPRNRPARFAK